MGATLAISARTDSRPNSRLKEAKCRAGAVGSRLGACRSGDTVGGLVNGLRSSRLSSIVLGMLGSVSPASAGSEPDGSPFNVSGQAGVVYAGNPSTASLINSNSTVAVSQYDTACVRLSHPPGS